MPERSTLAVSLLVAILVVLFAGLFLLDRRMSSIEDRVAARNGQPAEAAPPRGARGTDEPPPRETKPTKPGKAVTNEDLAQQIAQLSNEQYDYYGEVTKDLHEMSRTLKQVQNVLRNLATNTARPGAPVGSWGLPSLGSAPSAEQLERCRKDAEAAGVLVADGRAEVRGFLNMSPNRSMPIEYFVTRWPESGHETLVHVVGKVDLGDLDADKLKGLPTAIYKGLVAAGFRQGEGSKFEIGDDPQKPTWIPPTGEVVHLGFRYRQGGKTHLARATDWVFDPAAGGVLAEDCLRFTGSRRIEDSATGDEALASEESGQIVSVYRSPNTLVEIALASNLNDNYEYNYARIPGPATILVADGAYRVDLARDWPIGRLTIGPPADGVRPAKPAKPPTLVLQTVDGEKEYPFEAVPGKPDTWTVVHEDLKSAGREWRARMEIDGKTVETSGWEPFYLDLVFSKTPIVPEGDGALPIAPREPPAMDEPK